MITWEGTPSAFAIFNPYILAFESSFVEIRHLESGQLMHILTSKNIRMLHSSSREVRDTTIDEEDLLKVRHQILYAYEDEAGDDVIASLDFWSRPQSPQPGGQRSASASQKEYGKEYGR